MNYSFPRPRSKHEEIDLVSEEEFYQGAPPEISRPHLTKNDPHQLTLARLDWELEQRKRYKNPSKQSMRFVPAQSVCSKLLTFYYSIMGTQNACLKVYCWMQVGREIQGITSLKGDNSEEH